MGFTRCRVDHAVFHCHDHDSIVLAVDVDDITIAGDSKRGVKRFKDQLGARYQIKDMGDLNWLLGLEVVRDRDQRTITFSQSAYVQRIIKCFNLQSVKVVSVPLNPGDDLSVKDYPNTPQEVE